MKSVLLFYNPGSGNGMHSAKQLEEQIRNSGFSCKLVLHKEHLSDLSDADVFAIAGGDGTVRKFILQLLNRPLKYLRPIGLLPLGTANNISKTLKIKNNTNNEKQIAPWKKDRRTPFDVGTAISAAAEHFFIESMGFGIFPKLMKKMSNAPKSATNTPEEEFDLAFSTLYNIAETYEARTCSIELDGRKYAGKYLMVELMNIQNLGSNMCIAPAAEPGDGRMDIVMVPEADRALLLSYIKDLSTKTKAVFPFKTVSAVEVKINWAGKVAHVDDEVIQVRKSGLFKIRLLNQLLHFLT